MVSCVWSNLFCPTDEALTVPLHIFLVIRRHMHLKRAAGHTGIDLLLDVLIGTRIVLRIHTDVVVVLNCGNFPSSQLERMSGQRK